MFQGELNREVELLVAPVHVEQHHLEEGSGRLLLISRLAWVFGAA